MAALSTYSTSWDAAAWMPLPRASHGAAHKEEAAHHRDVTTRSPPGQQNQGRGDDDDDALQRRRGPPRVPRLPGKRRQRRREMFECLAAQAAKVGAPGNCDSSDDDDDAVDPRTFRAHSKRLIDDPEALRAFLNGATLRAKDGREPVAIPRRGPPRLREATRGWLRVERRLRPGLRRGARLDEPAVRGLERLVLEWLAAGAATEMATDALGGAAAREATVVPEPTVPGVASAALVLRVPTCVVDARLIRALAQFHGCPNACEAPCVVLKRPRPEHRLRHGASVYDVLS